jgi:hypothetical protein
MAHFFIFCGKQDQAGARLLAAFLETEGCDHWLAGAK